MEFKSNKRDYTSRAVLFWVGAFIACLLTAVVMWITINRNNYVLSKGLYYEKDGIFYPIQTSNGVESNTSGYSITNSPGDLPKTQ